jgi:predicted permease
MLVRILSILFPLFFVASLGYLVGRRMKPDLSQANHLNLEVFVPALVFSAMASKDFQVTAYLPLLAATALLIAALGVVAWVVARALGMDPKTLIPPMMFNNCGNLGLPLAVLAFGESALPVAVAMFVVCNVLQFSFGTWLLDHQARLSTVWKSPTILATLAGLAVGLSGVTVWPPLLTALRMVGEISVPLMLFALGVRMADSRISAVGFGIFGAVLRPVAGMALAWLVAKLVGLSEQEQAMLLVFGALPPAVVNFILAERYRQEPDKVASMVLIGNMASVVSLPVVLALALQ